VTAGRPLSLERLLIIRLSLLTVAAIAVATVVYGVNSWVSHEIETADQMAAFAQRVAGAVTRGSDGVPRFLPSPELRRAMGAIPDLKIALAEVDGGRPVDGSSPWLAGEVAGPFASWTRADFVVPAAGRQLQGIIATAGSPVGPLRVALVRGQPTMIDTLRWVGGEMVEEVLPVVLPVMALTLLVAVATVRSVVAPFKRLSADLSAVGPRLAGVHLSEEGVPREVLPMVQAINHAIERIDEALRQQRRMTANAAHELRTPLAILRARIDGLSDGAIRPALQRDVIRMTRLVEQLMTVARLEAGQVVVEGEIDLVHTVREVLADVAPLAMAQGRSVELVAPDQPVTVRGNAMALGDAVVNLVDNALRHTPDGGCVEVAVESALAGGGAALEVRDRGPGVAPAERAQLFEPFWRGADRRGGGAGLGLAIVAETVAVHGGSVEVRDRAGGGAVFRIELPGPGAHG